MIVFRIVPVSAIAHEPDKEVSVNSFIVMQWHEIQIVEPENGGDHEDPDDTKLPDAFRDVPFRRLTRVVTLSGMSLGDSLLAAT